MALLLISHDVGLMVGSVQQLCVMYAGRFVEWGATAQVLTQAAHPYTRGLLASRPRLGQGRSNGRVQTLPTIPGRVPVLPALAEMPAGCAFADRCTLTIDACRVDVPAAVNIGLGHAAACLRVNPPMGSLAHERVSARANKRMSA